MSVRATILDNLETALAGITKENGYETTLASVRRYRVNIERVQSSDSPMVIIVDAGPETPEVCDATHYRYLMDLKLFGVVKSDTSVDLESEFNNLVSSLKKFIDSGPSLGSAVLSWHFVQIDSMLFETGQENVASISISTNLRYVCAAGSF